MEIMKLFKKALVASAIIGTTVGAQAATIAPSSMMNLSAEGVLYKVAPVADLVTFDVVVDKLHPATSRITLTFDSKFEIGAADCASGSVFQIVGQGKGYCGDIAFDYGTGSFTFDNVVVTNGDATKGEVDTLSFDVNIGNPLLNFSAFRVLIGQHDFDGLATDPAAPATPGVNTVLISGESWVDYESKEGAAPNAVIETGRGQISQEVSQFSWTVTTELDGVIERDVQQTFVDVAGNTVLTDVLNYTLSNDEGMLLALTGTTIEVEYTGDFEDVDAFGTGVMGAISTPVFSMSTGATDIDTVTSTYVSGTTVGYAVDGSANKETHTYTPGTLTTTTIPVTGSTSGVATVTVSGTGTLPTGGHVIASAATGEWELDATIINVPYFPVNYADTSSSVHIANEAKADADVIVTAIDNNGTEYGPLNLGFDAMGNTVTKVSQTAIATLFGITDPTKLSVTFNIDADEEDVSAHAFTQNTKGRSEVSNSQLKGK